MTCTELKAAIPEKSGYEKPKWSIKADTVSTHSHIFMRWLKRISNNGWNIDTEMWLPNNRMHMDCVKNLVHFKQKLFHPIAMHWIVVRRDIRWIFTWIGSTRALKWKSNCRTIDTNRNESQQITHKHLSLPKIPENKQVELIVGLNTPKKHDLDDPKQNNSNPLYFY